MLCHSLCVSSISIPLKFAQMYPVLFTNSHVFFYQNFISIRSNFFLCSRKFVYCFICSYLKVFLKSPNRQYFFLPSPVSLTAVLCRSSILLPLKFRTYIFHLLSLNIFFFGSFLCRVLLPVSQMFSRTPKRFSTHTEVLQLWFLPLVFHFNPSSIFCNCSKKERRFHVTLLSSFILMVEPIFSTSIFFIPIEI